ncbi:hypothetical protein HUU05_16380 [candidate division KSB1 bacterium]|nr:hypothetical protein [candidate division KSB1 bacterium]
MFPRIVKFLILLFLPWFLLSCNSEESGAIADVKEETFMEAKIDGRIWKAAFVVPSQTNVNGLEVLFITGGKPSDQNLEGIVLQFFNSTSPDSFVIDTMSTQRAQYVSAVYTRGTEEVPEDFIAVSGLVKLTVREEKKVGGTFEFRGVEQSDSSKTVSVTEGKFSTPLK